MKYSNTESKTRYLKSMADMLLLEGDLDSVLIIATGREDSLDDASYYIGKSGNRFAIEAALEEYMGYGDPEDAEDAEFERDEEGT